MQEEQRKSPRVPFYEAVRYEQFDAGRLGGCAGYDLSEGGIRLRCEEFIPLEERVGVDVSLTGDRVLRFNGRVVWVQKIPHAESYQVGLRFEEEEMDQASRGELNRYIRDRLAD